jgi:hypothetical protein
MKHLPLLQMPASVHSSNCQLLLLLLLMLLHLLLTTFVLMPAPFHL